MPVLVTASENLESLTRKIPSRPIILPWINYQSLAYGIAVSGNYIFACSVPDLTNLIGKPNRVLCWWSLSAVVNTLNNTSNFWTVNLDVLDTSGIYTTISTSYTRSWSVGSWGRLEAKPMYSLDTTSILGLFFQAVKTGLPGPLNLLCPQVYLL